MSVGVGQGVWGRCEPSFGAHGRVGGEDRSGGAAEEGEIPGAPASSDISQGAITLSGSPGPGDEAALSCPCLPIPLLCTPAPCNGVTP